jgi:RNA polymerase sigma factor (sigma-70 family)
MSTKAGDADREHGREEEGLPSDLLWQHAISFVSDKKRKKIIEKVARKFMNFSPYEVNDYLAEATAVAFEAMRLSREKGESEKAEGYFWVLLKNAFGRISTNPAQQDVVPGEDAGPLACIFEEYTEEWNEESGTSPTAVSATITPLQRVAQRETLESLVLRKSLQSALELMTEKEREVWHMIFDGKSSQEISERLGTSRQNVEKLRDRGIEKIVTRQRVTGRDTDSRMEVAKTEPETAAKCTDSTAGLTLSPDSPCQTGPGEEVRNR